MVKKVLTWLFIGFLIFFLAFRPGNAASLVRWIGAALVGVASGLSDFLGHLAP